MQATTKLIVYAIKNSFRIIFILGAKKRNPFFIYKHILGLLKLSFSEFFSVVVHLINQIMVFLLLSIIKQQQIDIRFSIMRIRT